MFDVRERLSRSEEFALEERPGEGIFFSHRSGRKVQTDALGQDLWQNLPEEAGRIIDNVRKKALASRGFLEQYLFVLMKAGIIRSGLAGDDPATGHAPIGSGERRPERDLISAIVVTHNGEHHIGECLESLISQTYKNLEILVVDNGSQDNTVKIIEEDYLQARLFRLRKNRHFAKAVNFGIGQAAGKYFFILNQDVALEKDCLANLYRSTQSREKIGAVVPMMKFYHLRGFINGIGNHVRNYGWGSDNFIGLVDVGQFKHLLEVPSACFGAVLLNRDAVDDIGRLDGGYKSYYEDVDWSFRSWLRGWKIVPAADAVLYHKFGGSYLQDGKLRFIVGNRIRLVLKVFEGRILLGFLKRYFKEDIRCLLSFMKHKKYASLLAYVRGYFSLLFSLPKILGQRFRILARKRRGVREKDILAKNPAFFTGLSDSGQPIVDTSMILGYYRWEIDSKT
jgi:GT2 family glycosyltransferase